MINDQAIYMNGTKAPYLLLNLLFHQERMTLLLIAY